ncbi:MAG: BamA/TamA family outer membrane protein [Bacteroidaceae bacterium]
MKLKAPNIDQKVLLKGLLLSLLVGIISACSSTKYVPEGQYLLDKIQISSTDKDVKTASLWGYVRQSPNARWFSSVKVPLHIYSLSGRDSLKWRNRILRRIGQAPVIYDSISAQISEEEMKKALINWGYIQAQIKKEEIKKRKKIKLRYTIEPGKPYIIKEISHEVPDSAIAEIIIRKDAHSKSLLYQGMPLNIETLDQERTRIVTLLRNKGYYKFNKEYISYTIDTIPGAYSATMSMQISPFSDPITRHPHTAYHIGSVKVITDFNLLESTDSVPFSYTDSVNYKGIQILSKGRSFLRPKILRRSMAILPDSLYSEQNTQTTYANFGRLSALKYTNFHFTERADSSILDCTLLLTKGKPKTISFQLEGTNSAGDLGAAASISGIHRNLFHGSETLSLKLRGAYEAISGLTNAITNSYTEYGVDGTLLFPRFIFPFLTSGYRYKTRASTELALSYSYQERPEFARKIFESRWSYKWNRRHQHTQHRIDAIDLSYIKMPWISDDYRNNYLENSILKYNYQDQLIMHSGYGFVYNSASTNEALNSAAKENSYTIRMNFESAGNFLWAASKLLNLSKKSDGRYKAFGLEYEQYLKADFDLAKRIRMDSRNVLALHFALGVGYPYGNSDMLPFSKRYFSGGANSVRGWSVRGLGPGRYAGGSSIDFMNRSGDIKLDLSSELRTKLFWVLQGAFFIDAGNIWTIKEYAAQPGGAFKFNTFYKELAMAYGIGIRMDFDYFVLRFDGGMKAVNPAYIGSKDQFPIIQPNFGRDFTFHFAIGYPF